jgi:hypothetical protein
MDTQERILLALGRIEGAQAAAKDDMTEQLAEIRKLSERVSALEGWRNYATGAWAVLAAACAGAWAFFIKGSHGQ